MGQINPAGFQSLKYMYYIHVTMIIKWFWLDLKKNKMAFYVPSADIQEVNFKHNSFGLQYLINSLIVEKQLTAIESHLPNNTWSHKYFP